MENFQKAPILRKLRTKNRDHSKKWKKILLIFAGLFTITWFTRVWIVLFALQLGQFVFSPILPNIDDVEALFTSQSTIIYDREGSELYTIHGDENRFEIPFEKMPDTIKLATIASEDDQFFDHPGFDVDGIMRAVLSELGVGNFIGGGSTITQQFVKNTYLSPEKTYWRKLQELMLALKLENKFTKNEILEMYLNRIPYGSNAYGIQAAAQTFFNKNSEELTLGEAAILAALPQAPSRYSPYGQNRELLMGSCGKVEEQKIVRPVENLPLEIRANGEVWLRILIDDEIEKEGIFKKDETFKTVFFKNFDIVSGNQNFELLVEEKVISTIEQSNFSAKIGDFVKSESAETVAMSCDSINDPDYNPGRKDYVLRRMLELGFISQEEFKTAWLESNNLKFESYRESIRAPHFVFFVRDLLEEQFGKDVVERGGLRVFTTLDPELQSAGEDIVAEQFPQIKNEDGSINWEANRFDATNGSLLAVDNETGQILTMIGSRDYFETLNEEGLGNDGATNLTTRPRQPGSSFKPIAYTTGLKMGFTPASIFWDVETNFGKGTDEYMPQNYDGTFLGPMSLRRALDYSRNIPAVKMAILAGEKTIVTTAHDLGMSSVADDERYGPTIALGVAEIPMIEMIGAYSVFANGGYMVNFTPILKITDSRGNIIEEFEKPDKKLVIDPAVAYLMTNILSDSTARPSSWNRYLNLTDRPNAAKTGTANKKISEELILPGDVWTIGFTPQITAAAWMGNNNGAAMNTSGTGLTSASPIWNAFMKKAHEDLPIKKFKIPEGIVQRSVSRLTGKLASDTTPTNQITIETFLDTTVPLEVDNSFVEIEVDAASGKLPSKFTPESALIKKKFINLHSERAYDPEWERPVQNWLKKYFGESSTFETPPTEVDDLHTAETAKLAPTISIVAPISGSTVEKSKIGVWVNVDAPNGAEKVEFYRDNDLISIATTDPWKGFIPISLRLEDGDQVTITAKIFDKLFYSDTSTVEVIVGDDTQTPTARLTSPQSGETFSHEDTILISADAFDAGGDISKVEFFLDNSPIGEIKIAPYEIPLILRNSLSLGDHNLKIIATDNSGYLSSDSVKFEIKERENDPTADFAIVLPINESKISVTKNSIEVIATINPSKFSVKEVDFIARNISTGERKIFAKIENPSSETFSTTWENIELGEFEIYFKARDASGKTIISGRNTVEIK